MAMSNAERQRKYRLNRDSYPHRRQDYLKKEKKKYAKDKSVGKKKLVKDMTDREKRHARKLWRTFKKEQREKLKTAKDSDRNLVTPPSSPVSYEANEPQCGSSKKRQEQKNLKEKQRTSKGV
jgi:rubrerythrin